MKIKKCWWVFLIVVLGLILLSQMFVGIPKVSALSQPKASGIQEGVGLPAGLTSEEWQQVMGMIDTYEQTYLKASNVDAGDFFGRSVAISGNTLVVGAYYEDGDGSDPGDNSAADAGAAYVFVRDGTNWTQQAYLKASNAEVDDEFGISVGISGDTIVVGAYWEDSDGSGPDDNSASDSGAAYVFERSGETWTQQAYLKAANADSDDNFGYSVAILEDRIVVGAYSEDGDGSSPDNNGAESSGAVYVFERSGTTWTQQAYLKASNPDNEDYFGASVSISSDTIVVGARLEDSDGSGPENNDAESAGAVYIFVNNGSNWTQQAYLKADNAGTEDCFGSSVSISGDTVVVGAYGEAGDGSAPDDNSAVYAGAAYVFVRSGETWTQQAYLKAANAETMDQFGISVSILGNTVVVGAYMEAGDGSGPDNNDALYAGAAYVFVRSGETWTQQAYLKPANIESYDTFGVAVAISGNTIVVSAAGEDSDGSGPDNNDASTAGAAYVFSSNFEQYLPLLMR